MINEGTCWVEKGGKYYSFLNFIILSKYFYKYKSELQFYLSSGIRIYWINNYYGLLVVWECYAFLSKIKVKYKLENEFSIPIKDIFCWRVEY